MTQAESEKLFHQYLVHGKFIYQGKEYSHAKNWAEGIEVMIPDDRKMRGKICFISAELTLTNRDLDVDFHQGFTIGKGKTLYWMMIWHPSGNVTVFPYGGPLRRRWISGDTEITVHFKSKTEHIKS